MTDCLKCKWCKKAGLFNDPTCFAPQLPNAEPLHLWMREFLFYVGCATFEGRENS
jgi:hypothetical protein